MHPMYKSGLILGCGPQIISRTCLVIFYYGRVTCEMVISWFIIFGRSPLNRVSVKFE